MSLRRGRIVVEGEAGVVHRERREIGCGEERATSWGVRVRVRGERIEVLAAEKTCMRCRGGSRVETLATVMRVIRV